MKRLLTKLTSGCIFSFDDKLYKQVNGCAMGDPLSVTLAGIHMARMEEAVVKPKNPEVYNRYVDDIFTKIKIHETDELFNDLNSFHPSTKLTKEISPEYFLDTKIEIKNGNIHKSLHRKDAKLPSHWSSKIPKNYKRNSILTELHRAEKIADNFDSEIRKTRLKFKNAGFPSRYIESVINSHKYDKNEFIIPPNLFEERKTVLIELPYCTNNEIDQHQFLKKFHEFTGNKFIVRVIWKTRKIKTLFSLKDKNIHPVSVVYEGTCKCGAKYIGETGRNASLRWNEHENKKKQSEPAKHLRDNPNIDHQFNWIIIRHTTTKKNTREIIEAFFVALRKPNLNNQVYSKKLILFRNGIT